MVFSQLDVLDAFLIYNIFNLQWAFESCNPTESQGQSVKTHYKSVRKKGKQLKTGQRVRMSNLQKCQ